MPSASSAAATRRVAEHSSPWKFQTSSHRSATRPLRRQRGIGNGAIGPALTTLFPGVLLSVALSHCVGTGMARRSISWFPARVSRNVQVSTASASTSARHGDWARNVTVWSGARPATLGQKFITGKHTSPCSRISIKREFAISGIGHES